MAGTEDEATRQQRAQYEDATAVLDGLSTRNNDTHPLTQDDVDDIMWAIEQLDARNAAVRRALAEDESTLLSNEDIRSLESSVQTIRKVYQWISHPPTATTHQSSTSGNGANNGSTQNGSDPLPVTNGNANGYHQRMAQGPPSRRKQQTEQEEEGVVVKEVSPAEETLETISKAAGVPINELRYHNPDLEQYRGTDPLPAGVKIILPPSNNRQLKSQNRSLIKIGRNGDANYDGRRHGQRVGSPSDDEEEYYSSYSSGGESYYDSETGTWERSPRRHHHRHSQRRLLNSSTGAASSSSAAHRKLVDGELTLRELSSQCRLPIDDILDQNPNLEKYGDDEVIPYHEPVEVRRFPSPNHQHHHQQHRSSRHHQPRYDANMAGERYGGSPAVDLAGPSAAHRPNTIRTARGDTLYNIARHLAQCSTEELRDENGAELDGFGDDTTLPTGMAIHLPPSYSDNLRQFRAKEREVVQYHDQPVQNRSNGVRHRRRGGATQHSTAGRRHYDDDDGYDSFNSLSGSDEEEGYQGHHRTPGGGYRGSPSPRRGGRGRQPQATDQSRRREVKQKGTTATTSGRHGSDASSSVGDRTNTYVTGGGGGGAARQRETTSTASRPAESTSSKATKQQAPTALPGEKVETGTSSAGGARTLAGLADFLETSIDAIRHINPETDHYSDHGRLPHRMPITVPGETTTTLGSTHKSLDLNSSIVSESVAPGSRRSHRMSHRQEYVTRKGDTIDDVAHYLRIQPDYLFDLNHRKLSRYDDFDPLPEGMVLATGDAEL